MLGKNFLAKSIDVREIRDSGPIREGKRTPGEAGDAAKRDVERKKLRRIANKIKPEVPRRLIWPQKKRPAVKPGDKPHGARLYMQFLAGGFVIVGTAPLLTSRILACARNEKAADSRPRL